MSLHKIHSKGLPLSIRVVGGLLSKSKKTQQHWEEIAKNLNSIVNLEIDKHCLQILYTSYYNLPVHLKPYFLFMGVTLTNEGSLRIDGLVTFLVAEGLVKPVSGRSLEKGALECLNELIDRNLVIIEKEALYNWMDSTCKIHDLLGELCLRESEKQKFVYVVREGSAKNVSQNFDSIRRIYVATKTLEAEALHFLQYAPLVRSLWMDSNSLSLSSIRSRLLRTAFIDGIVDPGNFDQKVNLRAFFKGNPNTYGHFWNLQILFLLDVSTAPNEIWMMPQLRHIFAPKPVFLPDPPSSETDSSIILENLHRIDKVLNFKCSEEVVKRIPHIQCLHVYYMEVEGNYEMDYCLNNLGSLQLLKILKIEVQMPSLGMKIQNLGINFPHSLVMLTLTGISLHWDDMTTKIGSLPLLLILNLDKDSCIGTKWETKEGHFSSLMVLHIRNLDLEEWMMESTHFPCLEFLHLVHLKKLEEIPSSVGDIPTLERIRVSYCCESVICSAKNIKEEQEELGNEGLRLQILKL